MGRKFFLILALGFSLPAAGFNEMAWLSRTSHGKAQTVCTLVYGAEDPITQPIPFPSADDGNIDVFAVARARAEALKIKQGGNLVRIPVSDGSATKRGDDFYSWGVPRQATWSTEGRIYRHYTESQDVVDEIYRTGGLTNSYVTYEEVAPQISRIRHQDLTGIFLTSLETVPALVGRDHSYYFVDVRVPDGVPVLELEKDRIFLIPLPARTRPWVKDYYRKFLDGHLEPDNNYFNMCRDLKMRGGSTPDLMMPLEIVGSGRH